MPLELGGVFWLHPEGVLGPIGNFLSRSEDYDETDIRHEQLFLALQNYYVVFNDDDGNLLAQIMDEQDCRYPIHVISVTETLLDEVESFTFPVTSSNPFVRRFLIDLQNIGDREKDVSTCALLIDPVTSFFGDSQLLVKECFEDTVYLHSKRIIPISRKSVVKMMAGYHTYHESDVVNSRCPNLPPSHGTTGSFTYIVDHTSLDPRLAFYDDVGAHSGIVGTKRSSNNYDRIGYSLRDGVFYECPVGLEPTHVLRTYQYSPPLFSRMSKKTFLMVDSQGKPSHPVVGYFSYKQDGPIFPGSIPHGNSKKRSQPYIRQRADIRDEAARLLAHFSVKKVWHRLQGTSQEVSVTALRSIAKTVNRSGKTGRAPNSDFQELILAACTKRENVRMQQFSTIVTEVNRDGQHLDRLAASVQYFFVEAANVYLKTCPSAQFIEDHLESVKKLTIPTEKQEFLARACRHSDKTGCFLGAGGGISYDTTFELSDFYLSLMYAQCTNFRNKESQKTTYLVIGCVVHNTKRLEIHDSFFAWIGRCLKSLSPSAACPSIVSDDEASFRHMIKYPFFSHATHLLCDVHVLSIMKRQFGDVRLRYLKTMLFGSKNECLSTKQITLKRGILHSWNVEGFERGLKKQLDQKLITVAEHTWLSTRSKFLLERHGLVARLRAGFALQFMTSNVIECLNKRIKSRIGEHRRTAVQLIEDVVNFSIEEIIEIRDAIQSGTGYVETAFSNAIKFGACTEEEKYDLFRKYGLIYRTPAAVNFTPPLDEAIFQGRSDQARKDFIDVVCGYEVEKASNRAFVMSKDGTASIVEIEEASLRCTKVGCSSQFSFCKHITAVFRTLGEDLQKRVLESMVCETSSPQVRLHRGGHKGNRKFTARSVTNHSRHIDIFDISFNQDNSLPIEESSAGVSENSVYEDTFEDVVLSPIRVKHERSRRETSLPNRYSPTNSPTARRKRMGCLRSQN